MLDAFTALCQSRIISFVPLTSPEDYVRLGEHLKDVDEIFQRFLAQSGYSNNTGALGRYPHRSAVQSGRVNRKIDLVMCEDSSGQRFDQFRPEIPYSLWAGAWLDEDSIRYFDGGFFVFERLPFSKVRLVLVESLAQAAHRLATVTEASLKASGKRSEIRKS